MVRELDTSNKTAEGRGGGAAPEEICMTNEGGRTSSTMARLMKSDSSCGAFGTSSTRSSRLSSRSSKP